MKVSRAVLALVLGVSGAQAARLRADVRSEVAPQFLELKLHQGAWVPDDLAVVDQAIKGLLSLNLNAEKHAAVQKVADQVHKDLEGVTSGSKLSREERRSKVGKALKEIQGLSELLSPQAQAAAPVDSKNLTDIKARMAVMKKELAEKTAKLAEEQKELKLDTMKKELIEKKLELQKLLDQKREAEQAKKVDSADMKAQSDMVAKLVNMAKDMAATKPAKHDSKAAPAKAAEPKAAAKADEKQAQLKAILSQLEGRSGQIKAAISEIDAQEKKTVADLDAVASKHAPALSKDDALAKGQVLLASLKRDEHRKFEKARALKRSELNELDTAIASIKKGDLQGLTSTLNKMKRETKALDARSGNFLH